MYNSLNTWGAIQGPLVVLLIFGVFSLMLAYRVKFNKRNDEKSIILHLRIMGALLGSLELTFIIMFASIGAWWNLLYGDLCSFLSLVSPFILLSGNKKFIKMVLPWLFIGGFLTLISAQYNYDPTKSWWPDRVLSYIKHSVMLTLSIYGLITIGKYYKKDYIRTILFIAVFVLFVIVVVGTAYWSTRSQYWKTRIGMYSTALFRPSYTEVITHWKDGIVLEGGSYSFMKDIGPYPLPTILFYGFSVMVCLGVGYGSTFLSQWFNLEKVDTPKFIKFIRKKNKD
ncbi:MAG: YwaF family protein [Mycoplasma sp.]|nr:YwaF family protein [Mycoplasma sp.]